MTTEVIIAAIGIISSVITYLFGARKSKIENDDNVLKQVNVYLVEPLKKEINALRKTMSKLEKAISRANSCDYADNCPVKHELQKHEDSDNGNE